MNILERFRLPGVVVVITGATSGIGRAIALACAQAGATVAAIGRSEEKLEVLRRELAVYEGSHWFRSFDVTDYEHIPEVVDEIVACCGKIGGFVHSAGLAQAIPLRVMTARIYEEIYAVNVIAGLEFLRAVTRKNSLAEHASIVFISSISGVRGISGTTGYAATKGALLAGTRSLAVELAPKGTRVNALVPGHVIDTEIGRSVIEAVPAESLKNFEKEHLLGFCDSDMVACGALYLLSRASLGVTGTELVIDGGYCL